MVSWKVDTQNLDDVLGLLLVLRKERLCYHKVRPANIVVGAKKEGNRTFVSF